MRISAFSENYVSDLIIVAEIKQNAVTITDNNVFSNTVVDVFPNPASDICKIKIQLPFSMKLRLDFFNATGMCVKQISEKEYNTGDNEIIVNLENLSPGIYICKVFNKEFRQDIKFIRTK